MEENIDNTTFIQKDFTVILNKVEIHEGMNILWWNKEPAKIIKLKGNLGSDYCVIEFEKPDKYFGTILEIKKSLLNYLTYPE